MGHQIIQQPDGKLCVWSTVVDDFVITDATRGQLIEWYAREAESDARTRTAKLIDNVQAGNARANYYQFTMTYDEALALRAEVHDRESEARR